MHLTKTNEFDNIYDDFEQKFKNELDEHQAEVEINHAEADEDEDSELQKWIKSFLDLWLNV